uniref:NADPH-dependent FMN and FAD-containing oxidoreductase n=1 Tax=Guillardia theta TaxID=55529 RepID=A0A7S4HC64_GUITH|mmetsp:Transcript_13599/g.47235  ORF Transcript_13599/g.47235 Transcript_13599/m.47235 type:complete len:626 (+) Transcript_13599:67-1944(+)
MASLLILYGSQGGGAGEVAERLGRDCERRGYEVRVSAMDDYDVLSLPSEGTMIAVASTTGQGDAPDNMRKFWTFLLKKSLPAHSLASTSFAVFGLGDSSYAKFNAVAKRLDKRLEMLGGKRMLPLGLGDDQDSGGYDQKLDVWAVELWKALAHLHPLPEGSVPDLSDILPPSRFCVSKVGKRSLGAVDGREGQQLLATMKLARGDFHIAPVLTNVSITGEGAVKEVRHLEVDLSLCNQPYKTGDILAVQPTNRLEDVENFSRVMQLDLDEMVKIEPNPQHRSKTALPALLCGFGPVAVRDILLVHLDFMNTPRRHFFELLFHFATDKTQKERIEELSSVSGRDDLYEYCQKQRRTFLEVFRDFPDARPPLSYLFDMIPPLRPRQFSISSSPRVAPHRPSITLAMVDYVSRTKMRRVGVCTSYLKEMRTSPHPDQLLFSIKEGTLKIPGVKRMKEGGTVEDELRMETSQLIAPLIMVATGTGIAPFRSIIQERRSFRESLWRKGFPAPEMNDVLVFGCRTPQEFLYRAELEEYESAGHLKRLIVAYSRMQDKKVYVQDKIREEASLLWHALEEGGVIMVCGSSDKMPRDVRQAFVDVVNSAGQADDAEQYVRTLEATRRYLQETWS